MKATDTKQFFEDMNGGVLAEQLGLAISNASRGACHHGKKGKVVLTLEIKRIAQSNQVSIKHKLVSIQPTAKGKVTEEHEAETPMYVNSDADVTALPKDQGQLFQRDKA